MRLAVPAMTRVLALLVALIPTVMLTLAEDQSRRNKSEEPDSFGVDRRSCKLNLSNDRLVRGAVRRVARIVKKLDRTQNICHRLERLCNNGVLSKVKWSNAC